MGDDPTEPAYRKFLGDERKVHERRLKDLVKGVQSHVDTVDDVSVHEVLLVDKKRLEAVVSTCSAFVAAEGRDGTSHFANAFNEVCESTATYMVNRKTTNRLIGHLFLDRAHFLEGSLCLCNIGRTSPRENGSGPTKIG